MSRSTFLKPLRVLSFLVQGGYTADFMRMCIAAGTDRMGLGNGGVGHGENSRNSDYYHIYYVRWR